MKQKSSPVSQSQTFSLKAPFSPTGDQPRAIQSLVEHIKAGIHHQTLLGVTGSGKTFTMAHVIQALQKPTLVISHNKTLAAQLASEFKEFFPENAVHYFVSYYDYYQPEAYIPQTDTYIEKETKINEEIDRLRHASTHDVLTRNDVIIVASVSCIYGLGSPEEYSKQSITIRVQDPALQRSDIVRTLVTMNYKRNDTDLVRGTFRVRGDTIDIFPIDAYDHVIRITFFDTEVESITLIDPLTGKAHGKAHQEITVFPATHYLAPHERLEEILRDINEEMKAQETFFKKRKKLLEAQRIRERTLFDIEMIRTAGYCTGIENYSRYFDGRKPGEPPYTLLDYFPSDFLLFIDESHMTIPQIRGMYAGDRARKEQLIAYGFRLPSALDNRPLTFEEFEKKIHTAIYVSATPGAYEIKRSRVSAAAVGLSPDAGIVEQIIRPTGLLDPTVEVRPTKHQIDNLTEEIRARVRNKQRVLVTTLTKRMAEDLSDYLQDAGIRAYYLHSEIDTLERLDILKDLRMGTHDVIVGINLLREGLDLPEVSLVAILDADKEGFLRSETALIQTMGRAARHAAGHVILYADTVTDAMRHAIKETERRRSIQEAYNKKHGIVPQSIRKEIRPDIVPRTEKEHQREELVLERNLHDAAAIEQEIRRLTRAMHEAAENLAFEKAARLRDSIKQLKEKLNNL